MCYEMEYRYAARLTAGNKVAFTMYNMYISVHINFGKNMLSTVRCHHEFGVRFSIVRTKIYFVPNCAEELTLMQRTCRSHVAPLLFLPSFGVVESWFAVCHLPFLDFFSTMSLISWLSRKNPILGVTLN